jgi:hypothetical protein
VSQLSIVGYVSVDQIAGAGMLGIVGADIVSRRLDDITSAGLSYLRKQECRIRDAISYW